MVAPLRHRQTKEAATDMPGLLPPRHIPTLPLACLQLVQQLLRFCSVCKGDAGAEQGFKYRLSIGWSADAMERHREVVLDVRIARGREIGRAEIGYRLCGVALPQ